MRLTFQSIDFEQSRLPPTTDCPGPIQSAEGLNTRRLTSPELGNVMPADGL